MNKKPIEWLYELIGKLTEEKCPECQSLVLENKHGDQWCSKCFWANSEELIKNTIALFGDKDEK